MRGFGDIRDVATLRAGTAAGRFAARATRLFIALLVVTCSAGTASAAAAPAQFGEEGSGAGEFLVPTGIAVAQVSGEVFLADRNNQRADRFSGEGEFKLAWGEGVADGISNLPQTCTLTCFLGLAGSSSGEFALSSAEGAAVDDSALSPAVYIADQVNHRVQKFEANGTFVLMFGGEVNETKDDTLGATEAEKNICTAASGDVCKAGTEGMGNGQFGHTTGSIAVDSEGHVYVGDVERVQRFSPGGVFESQLTLTGAGDVTAIAVDGAKDLYVKSGGIAGVRKFDEGGSELGGARDALGSPESIAIGPGDELLVDDGPNFEHHILAYDAAGAQLSSFDAGAGGGSGGIAYGENLNTIYVLGENAVRLVIPPPLGPLVLKQSSEAVEPTSATLAAVVNPEGAEPSSYHFEYGTSIAYSQSSASEELTGGEFEDQPAGAAISGLQPRTLYHFRVVVSNGTETTDGPDQIFTTLPPVSIDGESATQVSTTSARLGAELNPLGLPSEYHFEYGLSASYEHSAPIPDASAGAGHDVVSVALILQGLSPKTTYHYRVVAHNTLGTVEGEDRTFTTEGAEGVTVLPDGREWEMVSPPDKEGVSLEAIAEEGGLIQSSEAGDQITYIAKAAIEAQSPSNRSIQNTQVLSHRSAGDWQSKDISTPHETVAIIHSGFPSEYKLFSGNLSAGIVEPQGATPLSAGTSERTPYLRKNGSEGQFCLTPETCYEPLVSACPGPGVPCPASIAEVANVPGGTKFGGVETEPKNGGAFTNGVEFASASPDASRVVLTSPENLTAGFEGAGRRNLYEWSGGGLRPVSILPGGESAGEAGFDAKVGNSSESNLRGAVSAEGDRVVFEAGHHLYVRDMVLSQTVQADPLQGGTGAPSEGVEFQGANRDASKILFTDDARLTSDSSARPKQPDLYECVVGEAGGNLSCTLHDLTVDGSPGEAANVQRTVSAFSEDGSFVYFAANGALAPGAAPGNCAAASEGAICNLYVRDTVTEQTKLVAELSGKDGPDWLGGNHDKLGELTARSSPDGRYLAFMSARSLTGYDNRDASSGERDEEVFLFDDMSSTVRCVSCNPSGARPQGLLDPTTFPGLLVDRPHTWQNRWLASSVPGWTLFDLGQALYQSRYLSNSGRMFFNSSDALVPQDANAKEDVYQYEPAGVGDCAEGGGCVSLISSGSSAEESAFMDASTDGSNVFFLTAAKLSAADVDGDFDLYDAHVCTSESPCPPAATSMPPPCATNDSCLPAPSPQPQIFGQPPSATFSGAGNLAPVVKPVVKPKPPTRAQLLSKALNACAKKPRKQRASCRATAQRRYGAKKKTAAKKGKDAKKRSRHTVGAAKRGSA
jgi:hypothetical protein